MYSLYHIKGVKWGCTKNLEKRLKNQGYSISDLDRLITVGNIDKAADMEKQLNLEYGYKWDDTQDYRIISKCAEKALTVDYKRHNHKFTKKQCSEGGYITGKKKTQKQQVARISNMQKINVYKTCPYCNLTTRGAAYFRYHGDKCKLNTTQKM